MNSTLVRMALRLILDLCIFGKFWIELSSKQMTSLKIFCGFSWSSARQQCRVGPFGHCNAACGTNIWDKEPNFWHAWKASGCDMLWLFDWRVSAFRSKGQHCSASLLWRSLSSNASKLVSELELEDDFEDLELTWVFQFQEPVNLKTIRTDHAFKEQDSSSPEEASKFTNNSNVDDSAVLELMTDFNHTKQSQWFCICQITPHPRCSMVGSHYLLSYSNRTVLWTTCCKWNFCFSLCFSSHWNLFTPEFFSIISFSMIHLLRTPLISSKTVCRLLLVIL